MTGWLRQVVEDARTGLADSGEAIDYLRGRGIPFHIAHEAGVGFLPIGYHLKAPDDFLPWSRHFLRNRLIFPLSTADGKYLGLQTRSLVDGDVGKRHRYQTYVLPALKGIESPIFHAEHAAPILFTRDRWQVVAVEGPMDALAVRAAGEPCVIATITASVPVWTRQWCRRWAGSVLALMDTDDAGRHGVDLLANHPGLIVSAPSYPAHDPSKLWQSNPTLLRQLVARPTDDDLLAYLKDLL